MQNVKKERGRQRKREKLITQFYNKFKILTGRMSYVIAHMMVKKLVSSQVYFTLSRLCIQDPL